MTDASSDRRKTRASRVPAQSRDLIAQMMARDRAREENPLSRDAHDPERFRRVRLTGIEIEEQPRCIDETLREERGAIQRMARMLSQRPMSHVYLVGCGDSLAAMLGMRGLLERLLLVPCEAIEALEYAYYYRPTDSSALVIGLSSTGWTTRVAQALLSAREAGMRTLVLSNTAEAPIYSIAEMGLLVHARREGWPTQSSTAAMALLAQLAIELARERGGLETLVRTYQDGLDETPAQIHEVIGKYSANVAEIAAQERDTPLFLFAGGGPSLATATVGAAKIKECTNRYAMAIQIEEYHHYLSQRAGEPLFIVAPNGPSTPRARDTAGVGRSVGGRLYGIVSEASDLDPTLFDRSFPLPPMDELLSPLVYSIPLQMFAYRLGLLTGQPVEKSQA